MDISNLKSIGAANSPLSAQRLRDSLSYLVGGAPAQLLDLYAETDGFLTPQGQVLYSAEDIAERNETFEVAEYSPGYLLVGDNSGGRGYLLSLDSSDLKVYSSDLGDLGPEDFEVEADSLATWVGRVE